jgi:hypothetical protein
MATIIHNSDNQSSTDVVGSMEFNFLDIRSTGITTPGSTMGSIIGTQLGPLKLIHCFHPQKKGTPAVISRPQRTANPIIAALPLIISALGEKGPGRDTHVQAGTHF